MENWKSMFKNILTKGRPEHIVENGGEGEIPGGEISLDQFEDIAEPGADMARDAVYARCGEVFDAS